MLYGITNDISSSFFFLSLSLRIFPYFSNKKSRSFFLRQVEENSLSKPVEKYKKRVYNEQWDYALYDAS